MDEGLALVLMESMRESMAELWGGEGVAVGGSVSASRGREVVNWRVNG